MRRHGVGVHAFHIEADGLRQFRGLRVLVHAAGLVRQRAAGVGEHDLQLGAVLHEAGEDQPRRRHAHLDDATEAEVQRAVITVENVGEYRIGGMQEKGNSKLLDTFVKRPESLGVDPGIGADAARQIGAHQSELIDRVIQNLDGDPGVLQWHRRASPKPAGIFALRRCHFFVPQHGGIAAGFRRKFRKINRQGADGAHDVHLMTEGVHVRQLSVEIGPSRVVGPDVHHIAFPNPPIVTAFAVALGSRISFRLASLVQDRTWTPMEMRIE